MAEAPWRGVTYEGVAWEFKTSDGGKLSYRPRDQGHRRVTGKVQALSESVVAERPSAYKIRALSDFGIEVPKLGCVMLDVEPIPSAEIAPSSWAYYAKNPERKWIKGLEAGDHITLLYGLLQNANTIRSAVDEVLDGWEPGELSIARVDSFASTFDDEPYACIIGHIKVTPELVDAHARLSFLPHIDTFWEYKPHLTLGYVHKEFEQDAIEVFSQVVNGEPLTPVGLNYGWQPDEH